MSIPGLALFYGGLVRRKNILGTMMHSVILMATVTVFIVSAYGWNSAFYAVSALSMLGALLFTQIDAGRKLAPDTTSPVV